jgi:uncharacterized membrane protein YccF (DUF307 family)
MQIASFCRAVQRQTIPDTKNVNVTIKTNLITIKSKIQRKKNTKPQKDSFSVSALGLIVKVFDYKLKGHWVKSSHIQEISNGK